MRRNAREERGREGGPLDEELLLERELRELRPGMPSENLRRRIEEEAARGQSGQGELAGGLGGRGTGFPPRKQVWAALSAAAALVAVVVAPFWMPGREGKPVLVTHETAPAPKEAGPAPAADVVSLDRLIEGDMPADWEQDEFLVGEQNDGVVEFDEGPAMWRVRYQLVHRAAWTDETTGTIREQFLPEERVLFVPVRHH